MAKLLAIFTVEDTKSVVSLLGTERKCKPFRDCPAHAKSVWGGLFGSSKIIRFQLLSPQAPRRVLSAAICAPHKTLTLDEQELHPRGFQVQCDLEKSSFSY